MIAFLIDNRTEPARLVRHGRRARRLRLEIPAILGDQHLAGRFEKIAKAWPGVVMARADARSGRMLLEYAPDAPLLHQLDEGPAANESQRRTERPRPIEFRPIGARPGGRAWPIEAQARAKWHARGIDQVFSELRTGPGGLSQQEAERRLRQYGHNLIGSAEQRSRLAILGAQFANAPMVMLLGSAGASTLLGEVVEAAAILVAVGLNAGIGYRIEHANEDVLTSWRKLEAGFAQVLRAGILREIAAIDLVPGDIIIVRAGDILPADARVIESHRLTVNEAPLTGESEPTARRSEPVAPDASISERTSMLHAGASVASGHGRAVVVATGLGTELARIRSLVEEEKAPPPPLAARMERLGRQVAIVSLGAAGVATAASLLHGRPVRSVIESSIALAVAALPEGLPLVATTALVRSMQRLHEHGLVVRRIAAAEALGGVTVICADKTGTLTTNEMRLEVLDIDGVERHAAELRAVRERLFEDATTTALAAGLLNSDVDVLAGGRGRALTLAGSGTERALVDAAHAAGLDGAELRSSFPRVELIERRTGVHYVVSLHRTPEGGLVIFVKGAPEQVLALCGGALENGKILARNDELAAAGLRVLAFAWRRIESEEEAAEPREMIYLGLAGLRDPLREGAAEAIVHARRAGIRTVILTGDQPRTADAVARELGIEGRTFLASELIGLSPAELASLLSETAVLARVAPEDKLAIVRALRAGGDIVAMAGDGINDAPALKAADVGVAVGASATDLARQVADIVMAGEDLRGILAAIGEGRIVTDNLRRALRFLFATNLSEMALVLGGAIVGAAAPLRPMQLLWINLLTDTLPGLALALEPGEADVLDRPPAPRGDALLHRGDLRRIGGDALLLAGAGAVGLAIGGNALAFSTLTAAQLSYAVICRAPVTLQGEERLAADRRFASLIGGGAALQLLAITLPPLRSLLGLQGPVPIALAGMAAGLAWPWISRAATPHLVIRKGSAQPRIQPAPEYA